jgi:signal transduction histidine kinase
VDQASVLIISDEPGFSRAVTSRWRGERDMPAFTLLGSDSHQGLGHNAIDLVLVGGIERTAMPPILRTLAGTGKPAVWVVEDNTASAMIKQQLPRCVILPRAEGWSDAVVLVSIEIATRIEAERRMSGAVSARTSLEKEASLGRYMLDARHGLNNALTSILGNSELLLLDPGDVPPSMISQLDTIRHMALRIHEAMQRFSSIEKELTFIERQNSERSTASASGSC